ncbi:hypothetical protein DS884_16570 [Tenacibaculum sp. E3R01]|uniref:hypothetical protein n=1 Tax=Tenacibaculum sp. E3R01 TaxID=2267227 RepID=UPI000DE8A80B|nr:hypothetical protein [Tenacibaculum sp. E3R01]RBW55242.1 hypothetical protein DS884_16570 [Tenacibaculum sp. E3R01]
MKKEPNLYINLLKNLLPIILPLVLTYILELKFGINIETYINQIPNKYFTIILSSFLLYSMYTAFKPVININNKNILFIASQNDYNRMDNTIGSLIIFTILFFAFIYFIKTPTLNIWLFISIIFIHNIKGVYLQKTVTFELKNNDLNYQNSKEKRTFLVKNIKEFKISPNQITVLYQDDSEKLISFLEIKEKDFRELKSWFQKRLPYITISKC